MCGYGRYDIENCLHRIYPGCNGPELDEGRVQLDDEMRKHLPEFPRIAAACDHLRRLQQLNRLRTQQHLPSEPLVIHFLSPAFASLFTQPRLVSRFVRSRGLER